VASRRDWFPLGEALDSQLFDGPASDSEDEDDVVVGEKIECAPLPRAPFRLPCATDPAPGTQPLPSHQLSLPSAAVTADSSRQEVTVHVPNRAASLLPSLAQQSEAAVSFLETAESLLRTAREKSSSDPVGQSTAVIGSVDAAVAGGSKSSDSCESVPVVGSTGLVGSTSLVGSTGLVGSTSLVGSTGLVGSTSPVTSNSSGLVASVSRALVSSASSDRMPTKRSDLLASVSRAPNTSVCSALVTVPVPVANTGSDCRASISRSLVTSTSTGIVISASCGQSSTVNSSRQSSLTQGLSTSVRMAPLISVSTGSGLMTSTSGTGNPVTSVSNSKSNSESKGISSSVSSAPVISLRSDTLTAASINPLTPVLMTAVSSTVTGSHVTAVNSAPVTSVLHAPMTSVNVAVVTAANSGLLTTANSSPMTSLKSGQTVKVSSKISTIAQSNRTASVSNRSAVAVASISSGTPSSSVPITTSSSSLSVTVSSSLPINVSSYLPVSVSNSFPVTVNRGSVSLVGSSAPSLAPSINIRPGITTPNQSSASPVLNPLTISTSEQPRVAIMTLAPVSPGSLSPVSDDPLSPISDGRLSPGPDAAVSPYKDDSVSPAPDATDKDVSVSPAPDDTAKDDSLSPVPADTVSPHNDDSSSLALERSLSPFSCAPLSPVYYDPHVEDLPRQDQQTTSEQPVATAPAAASSDDATKPPVTDTVSAAIKQQINLSLSAARSVAFSAAGLAGAVTKPVETVGTIGMAAESSETAAAEQRAGPSAVKLGRQKVAAGRSSVAVVKSGVSPRKLLQVRIQ
jgi:trimeric autotransporter adhesin